MRLNFLLILKLQIINNSIVAKKVCYYFLQDLTFFVKSIYNTLKHSEILAVPNDPLFS